MSTVGDEWAKWSPGVPLRDGDLKVLYVGHMGNFRGCWRLVKYPDDHCEIQQLYPPIGDGMPVWVEGGWSYEQCVAAAAQIAGILNAICAAIGCATGMIKDE